jgi:hypothetical protein
MISTASLGAIAACLAVAGVASAQSGGLGKPLPDADLTMGTVSVRVVLAAMDRPATSLPVSLVDDATGKERVVRTDARGVATFTALPPDGRFTAFTKIGDKEVGSEPFTVPKSGGLRILLSPAPIRSATGGSAESAGGAAMPPGHGGAGMAGGMPDPRQMSGMARPEQNDPAGSLTVRVIQGSFRNDPIAGQLVADFPKDAVVYLIGYGRGGSVTAVSKKVDEGGRVQFTKLRTDNSVSYYAMTALERTVDGVTVHDRLMTGSIELLPQVGMRVMLAGHPKDSDQPAIDDLPVVKQRPGMTMPDPGSVRVELAGRPEGVATIEILAVDAPTTVVASGAVSDASAGVQNVSGRSADPAANAGLRDGLIQVNVSGPGNAAIAGSVKLVTAGAGDPRTLGAAAIGNDGIANIEDVPAGSQVKAVLSVQGAVVESAPFEIPAKGGLVINFQVTWQDAPSSLGATITGVGAGKTYFARTSSKGRTYLSQPFEMVADRGVVAGILVYPAVLVGFKGGAELDDEKMWFQMQFAIANPSLLPLDTGSDGILIPLPPGFKNASVAEEMASRVKVEEHGLVWRGSFPPGQREFNASFAMPVEDGELRFDMPLPYGAWDSHLVLEDFPGADLNVPTNARRDVRSMPDGRRFVMMSQINIRAGQTLSFSITGLPQAPSWKGWARNLAGLGVLALLVWGFGSVITSHVRHGAGAPAAPTEELESRREALLARVVALDQKRNKGKLVRADHERERARLIAQLEDIYEKLER